MTSSSIKTPAFGPPLSSEIDVYGTNAYGFFNIFCYTTWRSPKSSNRSQWRKVFWGRRRPRRSRNLRSIPCTTPRRSTTYFRQRADPLHSSNNKMIHCTLPLAGSSLSWRWDRSAYRLVCRGYLTLYRMPVWFVRAHLRASETQEKWSWPLAHQFPVPSEPPVLLVTPPAW